MTYFASFHVLFHGLPPIFVFWWCGVEFYYSTSTCGADRRTVAVVITVNVVKVIKQNLQWFGQDLKKNGDNISSFPFSFLSSHPANDYFLLFLVSRGCSADNMQIQRMCEIISRLSNVWGFAHTQMEPFGNFIQHFRFLFMHKCSLSQYGQTEVVATNVIKSI